MGWPAAELRAVWPWASSSGWRVSSCCCWGWVRNNPFFVRYASINFLHFATLLFVISGAILVIVSLLTAPPPARKLEVFTAERKELVTDVHDRINVGLSILLAAIILALWIVFSPLAFGN